MIELRVPGRVTRLVPQRPCLTCTELSDRSYCPKHRNQRPPGPRWGSTWQWRKVRQQILRRDRHTCQLCGKTAAHVDHVVPVAHGGTDHPSNLRALCASCNLEREVY